MSTFSEIQGQLPPGAKLLAVSKLQSAQQIENLWEQGQRDFAENYVQEALDKQLRWNEKRHPIHWHFIGHLQTNKVKQVIHKFSLIHSVDSLKLARALAKAANPKTPQPVLIQLNLADESSKGGFAKKEFIEHWPELIALPGLHLCGLMTMPPLFEDPEDARPFFRDLRKIRDEIRGHHPAFCELSMGTSSDFRIALEEGATWVRLGTILFGARQRP